MHSARPPATTVVTRPTSMWGKSTVTHMTSSNSAAISAVLRVREIEAAAGVPLRSLVAVGGDPAVVLQHAGHVQQVPRHERGVAVGEVILGTAGAGIEIGRAWSGRANPAGIGLRRDHVPEMLQRV